MEWPLLEIHAESHAVHPAEKIVDRTGAARRVIHTRGIVPSRNCRRRRVQHVVHCEISLPIRIQIVGPSQIQVTDPRNMIVVHVQIGPAIDQMPGSDKAGLNRSGIRTPVISRGNYGFEFGLTAAADGCAAQGARIVHNRAILNNGGFIGVVGKQPEIDISIPQFVIVAGFDVQARCRLGRRVCRDEIDLGYCSCPVPDYETAKCRLPGKTIGKFILRADRGNGALEIDRIPVKRRRESGKPIRR